MKPAGQPKQAGCGEYPKSCILCMLVRKSISNVNDTTESSLVIVSS